MSKISAKGIFIKNEIFIITSMLVVIINNNIRGLVRRGFIEYFCNRVTKKKLVSVTKKIKNIYIIVNIAVILKYCYFLDNCI